ncbi:1-acyl-sn-glycerol-3-phosphate acyltransferase epsilon-like isoform X3 [Homarus americanus]|uniref:1-acyl-sn-glycerol-3-phosphate acyltransferase epsilon-like isoform X3 n=1 Tax=Homarus americanus TaxID=6706 RepID=UPI001C444111|nr:1-acyl-sn-glycerol-3-phosphate acyltransferase epsilon-like isoform X3 [Homarus americanus]
MTMASLESIEKYLKSLKININALKNYIMYALGSVMMIGAAPEYLGVWLMWRGATLVLPNWVYQWGDDKLYSLYQRLVLFFFETCTRTQVVVYGDADALKKKESVLYLANHQSTGRGSCDIHLQNMWQQRQSTGININMTATPVKVKQCT